MECAKMKFARRSVLSGLGGLAVVSAFDSTEAKSNEVKNLQAALEKAIEADGEVNLPAGTFTASGLRIAGTMRLRGIQGKTLIVSPEGATILTIADADAVTISGVSFAGGDAPATDQSAGGALVVARNVTGLVIENCRFNTSQAGGLQLEACAGRIANNEFAGIEKTALFARDSQGLEISGNHVHDIGNNGIQVWASAAAEDGTLVCNNRVERVAAKAGGDGQNGNGINVYRAGGVIVSGNRVSDCAFSAIRNNAGSNCQIVNNSIARTGEVAIYCEFGFQGAVVSGNLIADVAFGISITNFNEGGRLAVCANNVVRDVKGGGSLDYTSGTGIAAEADTQVTGNVIENARDNGIALGWGKYCRNLAASNNILRNCGRGIAFSVSEGAEAVMITGNRIAGSRIAAIQGMDHQEPVTEDLGRPGAAPPSRGLIGGNLVS